MPASDRVQNAAVEEVLFIKTSDLGTSGPFPDPQFGAAWELLGPNGTRINFGTNALKWSTGDHTRGLYYALDKGIVAANARRVLVVSDQKYFTDQLREWEINKGRGFMRANGKPYADTSAMIALDRVLVEKGISISGRPPQGDELHRLTRLKIETRRIAANNNRKPGDWDT